ncbi:hypothetical protein GUITHDRAFT_120059 [Guillardia theta CCMP2712]|uniref:Chalcone isomerase domain-containing protein n=1 Tax=Guillardia theta (strain CCMP2712) TaxID=905079 RepID=L1ICT7_GUITC|nr:hypothetical protein GUITHDRAFT_120059 [Guillardia theta CCMP2712]EKX33729.1 hypothetical protein GUITHDRAFT_120059 [Guillardia theta CCMP2712]|eukprot:XP_005820709.1 hypothetical protein GUITHDRAFT_120059 [Guillardia theta CCMP2712]
MEISSSMLKTNMGSTPILSAALIAILHCSEHVGCAAFTPSPMMGLRGLSAAMISKPSQSKTSVAVDVWGPGGGGGMGGEWMKACRGSEMRASSRRKGMVWELERRGRSQSDVQLFLFLSEETNVMFVADAKKKSSERNAVEKETGIKFPVILDSGKNDKETNMRLISAGCVSRRPWWKHGEEGEGEDAEEEADEDEDEEEEVEFSAEGILQPWKKINEYAVGLYVDATAAKAAVKAKGGGKGKRNEKQAAYEVLMDEEVKMKRVIRIVLATENDSHRFTELINDRIEEKMARKSFVDLAFLELWRNWMVKQGGYKQKLSKGLEVRFTWDADGSFKTEFLRKNKMLLDKKLDKPVLSWAVFEAFLGELSRG